MSADPLDESGAALLDSSEYLTHLTGAVLAAFEVLDDLTALPCRPQLLTAASHLLGGEPKHVRLARTSAHAALRCILPTAVQLSPAARDVVLDHLVPAGAYVVDVLAAADVLDPASVDAVAERRPHLVKERYRMGDETWEACEVLATLAQVRDRHREIERGDGRLDVAELSRTVRVDLESDLGLLASRVRTALATGREIRTDGTFYRRAQAREALLDALDNHGAATMTAELHAGDFFREHVEAVTAQLPSSPEPVPVIVLSNDRWMPELSEGKWPSTLYVERVALFFTCKAARVALADRAQGRLNHELVREVIHAAQEPLRRPQVAPPFDLQMLRTEERLREGVTEYEARQTMQRARATWSDDESDQYSAREHRDHPSYGCSSVAAGLLRAAFGAEVPQDAKQRWAHGPDRLGLLTGQLVGESGLRAKAALSTILDELFFTVDALRLSPNEIESQAAGMCEQALRRFVDGTQRLPLPARSPF